MDTASQRGRHNEGGQMRAREHAGKGMLNVLSANSVLLATKDTKWWKAVSILKDLSMYLESQNTHMKKPSPYKKVMETLWIERKLQTELGYSWSFLITPGVPWQWGGPQGMPAHQRHEAREQAPAFDGRLDYGPFWLRQDDSTGDTTVSTPCKWDLLCILLHVTKEK